MKPLVPGRPHHLQTAVHLNAVQERFLQRSPSAVSLYPLNLDHCAKRARWSWRAYKEIPVAAYHVGRLDGRSVRNGIGEWYAKLDDVCNASLVACTVRGGLSLW